MTLLEAIGDKVVPHECQTKKTARATGSTRTGTTLQGAVLDGPYGLLRATETYYDEATHTYYLSSAEMNQLVRSRGFYFLVTFDEANLIAPPELRPATLATVGGPLPLIPVSRQTFREFQQASDPSAFVKDFARAVFDVEMPSLTTATGPDHDFAIDRFVPAGQDRTAMEKARQSAFMTEQKRTVEEAEWEGKDLPMQDLEGMHPKQLMEEMNVSERTAWYVKKLGPYQAQLYESAMKHNVPMQLLAVVILNELGDIGAIDLLQSGWPPPTEGSLGIAQIQVSTAMKHRLVDVGDAEALQAYERSYLKSSSDDEAAKLKKGRRFRAAEQLQVPQVAIEAAAREIEILLGKMGENLDKPWQKLNGFKTPGPQGDATYQYFSEGVAQRAREGVLAYLVAAAYNSPNIVITETGVVTIEDLEGKFPNAVNHGSNARDLAYELYDAKLFRRV
jgi:hypothetical protein